MAYIIEIIISFLFEFLAEVIVQLLAELGLRGIMEGLQISKPVNNILSFFGYVALAFIIGCISLAIAPELQIKNYSLQIINLILSPVVIGLIMSLRGKILARKNRLVLRLDTFIYGASFALTYNLVRYLFHK